jgi:hypothetical protein
MTKLTGAALDRAVANALGLKSVHNCEKWGEHMNRIEEVGRADGGGEGKFLDSRPDDPKRMGRIVRCN